MSVTEAVLMVTSRCNSQCRTCGIWKERSFIELEAEKYWRLPNTLKSINISGGEPFVREDLPEVLEVISRRCNSPRVVISTNAILVERIEKQVRQIINTVPRLAIRISIDGIGSIHDEIRGVPGNYNNCLEVIKFCKGIGVKDIGIGTTISRFNETTFSEVKDLADSLGVQFTCTAAHSSAIYFGGNEGVYPEAKAVIPGLLRIQNKFLQSWSLKNWFRAYFSAGLVNYLEGAAKAFNCRAGEVFIFIKANGDIFPCNMLGKKMGNFLEEEIEDIIANSDEALSQVRSCSKGCWMICSIVPMIKRNPLAFFLWVAKKKAWFCW